MATDSAQRADLIDDAVRFLSARLPVAAVILFGSHVRGDTHEWSDVDLAVFSSHAAQMTFLERVRLASELQIACGFELEPHFFPAEALHDPPKGSFVAHIVRTGRRIV